MLAAFLAAPQRFDPSRGVALRTWLLRVTRNRAIDLLRKRAVSPEVDLPANVLCPDAVPLAVGAGLSLARLVEDVCETLPAEQRRILWWYAYKMSHRVIAGWVGKSEEAVRQVVARVKREVTARLIIRIRSLPLDERLLLEERMAALVPALAGRAPSERETT